MKSYKRKGTVFHVLSEVELDQKLKDTRELAASSGKMTAKREFEESQLMRKLNIATGLLQVLHGQTEAIQEIATLIRPL